MIILTVSASIADPPARSRHPPTLPPTDDTNIDTETRPGQGQRVLSSPTEAQVGVDKVAGSSDNTNSRPELNQSTEEERATCEPGEC